MTSDTKTKRLIEDLRRYAKRYEDGSTLGRAIESTEDLMYEAAALIEEQQRKLSMLSEVTATAERILRTQR